SGPVRYTHRTSTDLDIYFVSNRENKKVEADCFFRIDKGTPELWDPLTGEIRALPDFNRQDGHTRIPMQFEAYQSFFIVFEKNKKSAAKENSGGKNFPGEKFIADVKGPWNISFDPKWGGPENVTFDKLEDWTTRPEQGIKYYSGIAVYHKTFDLPKDYIIKKNERLYLDLGQVDNLAAVLLNGKDLGVVWTAPWRVEITNAIRRKGNRLAIKVANLWPNRLIGDEQFPYDGIKDGKWPDWLLKGKPRTSGRYTFTTTRPYRKDSPLLKSGLLGPVRIVGVVKDVFLPADIRVGLKSHFSPARGMSQRE
ncbi:MAG: hypothetical protein GXO75_10605, partial [Calditrichaeota bacterium]|nr:hypothetical protein [Calditrichota bacterium]